MRIGLLTSSRADYGIYLPLLKALKADPFFELSIIAFGTHLSKFHGFTIENIIQDGFEVAHKVESLVVSDSPNGIATSMGLTSLKFSDFWNQNHCIFDIVFCLGDRFEMFAAVVAGIPFGVRFAHIHGGETTLGAIDNIFRHSISHASCLHFTATETYKTKVFELTGSNRIYNVGSLSIDNLNHIDLYTIEEMKEIWKIDYSLPSILITVHPETVNYQLNNSISEVCFDSFKALAIAYQLVITLPNADTGGSVFRSAFFKLRKEYPDNITIIENFGTRGYFSSMHLAKFLIGNTSSGLIEAASLKKYVLNLGDRQKGRLASENVINCPFEFSQIMESVNKIKTLGNYSGDNIYFESGASRTIIKLLKNVCI